MSAIFCMVLRLRVTNFVSVKWRFFSKFCVASSGRIVKFLFTPNFVKQENVYANIFLPIYAFLRQKVINHEFKIIFVFIIFQKKNDDQILHPIYKNLYPTKKRRFLIYLPRVTICQMVYYRILFEVIIFGDRTCGEYWTTFFKKKIPRQN